MNRCRMTFVNLKQKKTLVVQVRKLQTSAGDAIACFSAHNKQYGFVAIANICWGKFVNFKKMIVQICQLTFFFFDKENQ